jgi:hypothetical protein
MDPEVVQILTRAIARGVGNEDLRERFAKAGSTAEASSPEDLRKRYEEWMGIFGKIAQGVGIKPQ